jgi:hypothetical protein
MADFKAETGALSGICHRPPEADTVALITRHITHTLSSKVGATKDADDDMLLHL